jgi:prefoldin subunit 5
MPANRSSDKSNSDIVELGVDALMRHEKQMDSIIKKLVARREELSSGTKKLNANLDDMDKKLRAIEDEINKLKNSLST